MNPVIAFTPGYAHTLVYSSKHSKFRRGLDITLKGAITG